MSNSEGLQVTTGVQIHHQKPVENFLARILMMEGPPTRGIVNTAEMHPVPSV